MSSSVFMRPCYHRTADSRKLGRVLPEERIGPLDRIGAAGGRPDYLEPERIGGQRPRIVSAVAFCLVVMIIYTNRVALHQAVSPFITWQRECVCQEDAMTVLYTGMSRARDYGAFHRWDSRGIAARDLNAWASGENGAAPLVAMPPTFKDGPPGPTEYGVVCVEVTRRHYVVLSVRNSQGKVFRLANMGSERGGPPGFRLIMPTENCHRVGLRPGSQ